MIKSYVLELRRGAINAGLPYLDFYSGGRSQVLAYEITIARNRGVRISRGKQNKEELLGRIQAVEGETPEKHRLILSTAQLGRYERGRLVVLIRPEGKEIVRSANGSYEIASVNDDESSELENGTMSVHIGSCKTTLDFIVRKAKPDEMRLSRHRDFEIIFPYDKEG